MKASQILQDLNLWHRRHGNKNKNIIGTDAKKMFLFFNFNINRYQAFGAFFSFETHKVSFSDL